MDNSAHKSIMLIFIIHMFVMGIAGIGARMYIASFLLSSEAMESNKAITRFVYRYLIFWTNYMISFMVTPAVIIVPIFGSLETISNEEWVRAVAHVLLSLPMAILFFWLERKAYIWGDKKKKKGIDEFNKKFRPKHRR